MGMPNKRPRPVGRPLKHNPKGATQTRKHALGTASVKPDQEIWSFFSGAMGLDLGLEAAGLKPTLAVEIDPACCHTIRTNRPELTLLPEKHGDVTSLHVAELSAARNFEGEVFLMVGGPPARAFPLGEARGAVRPTRQPDLRVPSIDWRG